MKAMELQKNLENLHGYWHALGAEKIGGVFTHGSWPNKQWQADFTFASQLNNQVIEQDKVFATVADTSKVLSEKFNQLKSQLVIMSLNLNDVHLPSKTMASANIEVLTGNTKSWTQACSEAFAYDIDDAVIQQLTSNPNACIIAYYLEGEIAGTAIAFQTGNTLGIHQLGTVPNYRKRGVADALMQFLLQQAKDKHCSWLTLQASQAGLHLYKRLGFKELGLLSSIVAR